MEVQQEIEQIKARNAKVELDKARETSWTRKICIAILTYIVVVLFFLFTDSAQPFLSAVVPTVGFLLSTLSIGVIKNRWIKNHR